MQIREYSLPKGWFPHDPGEITRTISDYLHTAPKDIGTGRTCIVPHAGWYYSGRLAALGINCLEKDIQTVAVIGGHLPCDNPVLFAMEDGVRTPLGVLQIDNELRLFLIRELDDKGYSSAQDLYKDNTVEVLVPMIKHFLPKADLLWLRLPASKDAYKIGKLISKTAKKLGRKTAVVGSTDLTHYGRNYGFLPHGTGEDALRWVREVNDAAFIKAVESGDPGSVLERATDDLSSCSAGAVLGAMGFAAAEGAGRARLIEYGTSADSEKGRGVPDSFVGYAAIRFADTN